MGSSPAKKTISSVLVEGSFIINYEAYSLTQNFILITNKAVKNKC